MQGGEIEVDPNEDREVTCMADVLVGRTCVGLRNEGDWVRIVLDDGNEVLIPNSTWVLGTPRISN